MKRTLLYYPSISLPQGDWIKSVLLYSDEISSILPSDSHEFPDEVKILLDNEEYRPMHVRRLLDTSYSDFVKFEERFFNIVASPEFRELSSKKNKIPVQNLFHLYQEKLTYNIKTYLDENHLIYDSSHQGELMVEETAAILYMSLLAQFVTEQDENLVIPCTDDPRVEEIAFQLTENKKDSLNLLLDKCLPIPRPDTDIKDIIKYKQKHRDELLRFRQFLSNVQSSLNKAEDSTHIKTILVETKEKIELELNDINSTLRSENIKTGVTSLNSLLKLETPKLFSSLAAAGFITTALSPVAGIVAGSIGVAGTFISSYLETKSKVEKNELSYLFNAQKNIGLNSANK